LQTADLGIGLTDGRAGRGGGLELAITTAVKNCVVGGEIVARGVLILMVIHVCAEAIGRYAFNQPLPMTIEIVAYYYLVAIIFWSLAGVEMSDSHTKVELLSEVVSPRASAVADTVSGILSVGILALMTIAACHEAIAQTRVLAVASGPFFDLPVWPARWLVPTGLVMFLAVLVMRTWTAERRAVTP
tara:strand:+ start:3072 stop:3632 length:561 start_codon:yes stop_codon:yes gene_type:complete